MVTEKITLTVETYEELRILLLDIKRSILNNPHSRSFCMLSEIGTAIRLLNRAESLKEE